MSALQTNFKRGLSPIPSLDMPTGQPGSIGALSGGPNGVEMFKGGLSEMSPLINHSILDPTMTAERKLVTEHTDECENWWITWMPIPDLSRYKAALGRFALWDGRRVGLTFRSLNSKRT